jgi:hypothetical protein
MDMGTFPCLDWISDWSFANNSLCYLGRCFKMTTYRAWQMNSKNPVPQEISTAVQNFISKMGYPPQILEHSDQLEKVELPDGLSLVKSSVRIPKNMLLIGVSHEEETPVRVETLSE